MDDNIYYYVLEHRLKSEKILVVAIRGKLSLYEDICIYGVYNYSIREEFVMVSLRFFFYYKYNFLAGINLRSLN